MNIAIDATRSAIGRVASFAAKEALKGKKIDIVNCNEALILGTKKTILDHYKQRKARGGSAQRGPNISRLPYLIMKRTIRGMLPYKNERGKTALGNIKCHDAVPEELKGKETISLQRPLKIKGIKLSKLSEIL